MAAHWRLVKAPRVTFLRLSPRKGRVKRVTSYTLIWLGPHDVDGGGVKIGLDVRCIVFLDHLDAGAAVLGDLVDIRALHEAQANICMPQAISRSRSPVTIKSKILFLQDRLEKLA